MTAIFRLVDVLETQNVLGECALWNAHTQALWWTDIQDCCLYRYDLERNTGTRYTTPERLCSFGFATGGNRLIAAFASGIALYTPRTGETDWLYRLPQQTTRIRFNDGRMDRDGRFWTGTMIEGPFPSGAAQARLYRIGVKGRIGIHSEAIQIANAICVSPDGGVLYFSDMPRHTIFACDLDRETGDIERQRIFARTPQEVSPDGATVDSEGYLWNAHWGAGKIVRYAPDGRAVDALELPVSQPTCIAFGGPHMNLLFVTTAREGLSRTALAEQPMAGNLFIYETDITGLADAEYVYEK